MNEKNDLRQRVEKILEEFLDKNGVEIFGKLKVEVVRMDTPALVKGNKIYINVDAEKYSDHVLKYLVAHELAHLKVKRHTKKFWEIVKNIYPQYEEAREKLLKELKK
nr:M48 family metallopeptidase [Candidatus Baldrarchaeota archaeon]